MFRRLTTGDIRKNVENALAYFGISALAGRSAKTLSGGEAKESVAGARLCPETGVDSA
jgi:energy-coupling factor transporter ATP-binding protein EcfA2